MLCPKITNVEPIDNYTLKLYYENGEKNYLMFYHTYRVNGMKNCIMIILNRYI